MDYILDYEKVSCWSDYSVEGKLGTIWHTDR
jgi:hypothetical protein